MSDRAHLSIGEVLSLLREEFPDITISKIRFLESQGLLDPERTPSGYRKFYDSDVERLRWILRQQREHFLPLKVIKGRLSEAGSEPSAEDADTDASAGAAAVEATIAAGLVGGAGRTVRAGGTGSLTAANPSTAETEARTRRHPSTVAATLFGGLPDDVAASAGAGSAGPGSGPASDMGDAAPAGATGPTRTGAAGRTSGPPDRTAARAPSPDQIGTPDLATGASAGRPTPSVPATPASSGGAAASGPASSPGPAVTPGGSATIGPTAATPGPAATPGRAATTASAATTAPPLHTPAPPPATPAPPPPATTRTAPTTRPAPATTSPPPPIAAPPAATGPANRVSPSSTETATGVGRRQDRQAVTAARPTLGDAASEINLTVEELATSCGLPVERVKELERFGLVTSRDIGGTAYYDAEAQAVAVLAAGFAAHGVEARHLRMYKNAAERESGLFEQVVMPLIKQRNPQSRQQAAATLEELARLGADLRDAMLRQSLRDAF